MKFAVTVILWACHSKQNQILIFTRNAYMSNVRNWPECHHLHVVVVVFFVSALVITLKGFLLIVTWIPIVICLDFLLWLFEALTLHCQKKILSEYSKKREYFHALDAKYWKKLYFSTKLYFFHVQCFTFFF